MTKSNLKTRVEKYPVPSTIDGICSLFREIMSGGAVQRIEFDVNMPVRVIRAIQGSDPDLQELDVGWAGALRNLEDITEYTIRVDNPFQVLVGMTFIIQGEGLNCTSWVIGSGGKELLRKWLGLTKGQTSKFSSLVGIPIKILQDLPEDTLILCGSVYPNADPSEVSSAVKTAIEVRSSHDKHLFSSRQAHDSIGPGPQECSSAVDPLALAPRRLRKIDWQGPSNA